MGRNKTRRKLKLRETRKQRELRRSQGKFTKLEKRWLAMEAEEYEIAHGCSSCKKNCSCVSDVCMSKA
jgi:hypothetical protein